MKNRDSKTFNFKLSAFNSSFRSRREGFTLIEMIVAVAIFAVVITISLGSFLNISDIQKKAMAFRAVNDNLNFAVEIMAREMRTGTGYCASACGPSSFNFTNSDGGKVEYILDGGTIKRSLNGGAFLALTSSEVEISGLKFILRGEAVGDGLQPFVTIIMRGLVEWKTGMKSELNLQTTVSQRAIDS